MKYNIFKLTLNLSIGIISAMCNMQQLYQYFITTHEKINKTESAIFTFYSPVSMKPLAAENIANVTNTTYIFNAFISLLWFNSGRVQNLAELTLLKQWFKDVLYDIYNEYLITYLDVRYTILPTPACKRRQSTMIHCKSDVVTSFAVDFKE